VQSLTAIRTSPRSYGICLSQSQDYRNALLRPDDDKFSGKKVVRDQANWLIQKSDLIPAGSFLTKEATVHFPLSHQDMADLHKVQVQFVVTSERNPQTDLKRIRSGKNFSLSTICDHILIDCSPAKKQVHVLDVSLAEVPEHVPKKTRKKNGNFLSRSYWVVEMKASITVGEYVLLEVHCGGETLASKYLPLEEHHS
jgi:hypothetical protein